LKVTTSQAVFYQPSWPEKISISPIIAGIPFVERRFGTVEIIFISPISLLHLSLTPKVIFNSLGVFSITPKVLTPTPSLLIVTLLPAVQPTAGKCPVDSREQSDG
jgi:hypothetical protein